MTHDTSSLVARAVTDNLSKASWIRRMFEEGARLKQERGADKVFDFTLGNPEIEPPPEVLATARRLLEPDAPPHLHAYMPNAGHPKVREAVARRVSAATGLPYTANHILMTVGAGAALNTVLKALLDPGDEVITVAPFFVEYVYYAQNHGGSLVVVPPRADLTPDVEKIANAITPKTRAIIVNSPNNPSGVIYPQSAFVELERVPSPKATIEPQTKSSAYKAWIRSCLAAGVTNRSVHSTRHTFITHAQRGGADRRVVELVTHNPKGTIVDVYTTRDWSELCAAVAALAFDAPRDVVAIMTPASPTKSLASQRGTL